MAPVGPHIPQPRRRGFVVTAYQLRIHLQRQHGVRLIGLDYACLLAVHDDEHRGDQDHDHEDRTNA